MSTGTTLGADDWFRLTQLYAEYARVVDSNNWDLWIDLFTDDCVYRLQPRENYERGFPLATLSFTGKGMLKDRAYAIRETLFHDPYYQRHVVGLPVVRAVHREHLEVEANYAVFRTKLSEPTTVFNVGWYLDVVARTPTGGFRFASKQCIYDSELIPNSIIYPI